MHYMRCVKGSFFVCVARWFLPFAGICVCAYAVLALPLCGAAVTFFAPAKKVTKESGLTPPILDRYPRALNVPVSRAATNQFTFVASAPIKCLTHFMHSRFGTRHRMSRAPLRQTLCRPSRHTERLP